MKIERADRLQGTVMLPGDKSISHRAAILASMADGVTEISNFAMSADCASTLSCLETLGVRIERDGSRITVHGVGKRGFSRPSGPLDCGNSGTTMRLLAGVLAGQSFDSVLVGDESLSMRPMKRIIDPLGDMGVGVDSVDGHAPLTVHGSDRLRSVDYRTPSASAQVKSCVLLAGLNGDGETAVTEAVQTRDHTERMLLWFGADVRQGRTENGDRISVFGDATLCARDVTVPSDISSAAFFMVAGACLPGSRLEIPDVGMNPTRRSVVDVLRECGADISEVGSRVEGNEPMAHLRVVGGLRPASAITVLRGDIIANLIDEIPILAVFGTQLEGGLEIRDAAELRVKESDRIASVVTNLRKMGADVEEFDDGLRVRRSALKGACLESFGDHRIAMAFAVAGLFADGETEIVDAECVSVSFPGFFDVLREASVRA